MVVTLHNAVGVLEEKREIDGSDKWNVLLICCRDPEDLALLIQSTSAWWNLLCLYLESCLPALGRKVLLSFSWMKHRPSLQTLLKRRQHLSMKALLSSWLWDWRTNLHCFYCVIWSPVYCMELVKASEASSDNVIVKERRLLQSGPLLLALLP